ncbi:hypothetical protein J6590_034101 [Homalodisca vitripennis]|nr:hypothetical protein J6590_034101 [Homalodisca vitripennis]
MIIIVNRETNVKMFANAQPNPNTDIHHRTQCCLYKAFQILRRTCISPDRDYITGILCCPVHCYYSTSERMDRTVLGHQVIHLSVHPAAILSRDLHPSLSRQFMPRVRKNQLDLPLLSELQRDSIHLRNLAVHCYLLRVRRSRLFPARPTQVTQRPDLSCRTGDPSFRGSAAFWQQSAVPAFPTPDWKEVSTGALWPYG